jgi:hypothetical protein
MEYPYKLTYDQKWLCLEAALKTKMYLPLHQVLCKCRWQEDRPDVDEKGILTVTDLVVGGFSKKAPDWVELYRLVYAFRPDAKKKAQKHWVFLGISAVENRRAELTLFILNERPAVNEVPDFEATKFSNKVKLAYQYCDELDAIHYRDSNKQHDWKTDRWNRIISYFVPLTVTRITPEERTDSALSNEPKMSNPATYQSDWSRFRGFLRLSETMKFWMTDSAASASRTVIKFDSNFAKMMSFCGKQKAKESLLGKYGVSKQSESEFHVADGITEVRPLDPDHLLDKDKKYFQDKISFETLSEAILGLRQSLKETNIKMKRIFTDEEAMLMEGLIAEKFYSNHGFHMDGYAEMTRSEFTLQKAAFDVDQVVHEMKDIKLPKAYQKYGNDDFLAYGLRRR